MKNNRIRKVSKCQFRAGAGGVAVELLSLLSFERGKVLRRKTRSEKNRKISVLWPEKHSRTQNIIEGKINNISKLFVYLIMRYPKRDNKNINKERTTRSIYSFAFLFSLLQPRS